MEPKFVALICMWSCVGIISWKDSFAGVIGGCGAGYVTALICFQS